MSLILFLLERCEHMQIFFFDKIKIGSLQSHITLANTTSALVPNFPYGDCDIKVGSRRHCECEIEKAREDSPSNNFKI